MDKHEKEIESAELSIWFFCGILMLAYGVVLVITGISEFNHPPPNEVLLPWLEALHPTLWWGAGTDGIWRILLDSFSSRPALKLLKRYAA